MSKSSTVNFLISSLCCLFTLQSNGQIDQFEITFPHSSNSTLVSQDEKGYIWFPNSDNNDFFRFNGQRVNALGLPELTQDSMSHYTAEQAIFIDSKLLLHSAHQLSLLDCDTKLIESTWQIPADHLINYVYKDDAGMVWVFTSSVNENSRPVYRSLDGRDYSYAFDLAIHFKDKKLPWWSILRDADGLFYFHNEYGDLLILNAHGESQALDLANPAEYEDKYECSVFRLDNKNVLWRMYEKEFSYYDKALRAFISHPLSGTFDAHVDCKESYKVGIKFNFIWTDFKGRIWLGGENSNLFMYDEHTDTFVSFGKTILDGIGGRGGDIHSIIGDGKGNLYGAKRGGVFKVSDKKSYFQSYAVNTNDLKHHIYDGNQNPYIQPVIHLLNDEHIIKTQVGMIQEDEDGTIYFIDDRFLFKLNQESHQAEILPFFDPFSKLSINISSKHKFLAMWSSVLSFDDQYQSQRFEDNPQKIEQIFTQKNGTLWFTGYRKINYQSGESIGLFATTDPTTLRVSDNYKDPSGFVDFDELHISSIDEDEAGNLWLGTLQGIYQIRTASDGSVHQRGLVFPYHNQQIQLDPKDGVFVRTLAKNRLGIFTRKDICILNTETNTIEHYISNDQLAVKKIVAVCFSEQDALWFSSLETINYYNFSTELLLHFSADDGYSESDATRAMLQLKNGNIATGTENGLYIFNPQELINKYEKNFVENKKIPLHLNSFSYLLNPLDSIQYRTYFNASIKPIILAHNDKMLRFEYSLMDFKHVDQHKFSYWLDGYDKQWSKPVSDNTVLFTSLPPGRYTLKTRAHNGNGIWSQDISSIPIHIKTAWYTSWWFLAACLMTLLTLAYILFKHYLFLEKTKLDHHLKQLETEKLRDVDNAKNLFFTNITHEFRTPLTVIMGVNDNSEAQLPEKNLISRNAKQLLHLVNQILDLSKLESNKIKLHYTQDDIIAYLKYLTVSFSSVASSKGIQLEFETTIEELIMNYDEVRIQQIIYNLISNALKFTPQHGRVSIHLDILTNAATDILQIQVIDNGHGIPAKDLPQLFDHFYQGVNEQSKVGEGTGIGLSLTRELVEIMDGDIQVKSTLDVGSEFTVLLPIKNVQSDELIPATFNTEDFRLNPLVIEDSTSPTHETVLSDRIHNYADQSKPILLLIEDNPDVVSYICSILEETYQIVISINGEQGIQKAIEIIPDIIISDVMMPIKDGYEVCQTLKQNTITDHIPIVILTAKASIENKLEGLKYGADAYLNKPFNKDELLIRLEQLLLVRQKMQEHYKTELFLSEPITAEPIDPFILSLNECISAHLSDINFGVPELAQSMLMSQTQVYRKSKALLNQTPLVLIRSFRLSKSQELLKTSTHTISAIAKLTGFANPNYFSRAFQKEYGTSPSDFRRLNKRAVEKKGAEQDL